MPRASDLITQLQLLAGSPRPAVIAVDGERTHDELIAEAVRVAWSLMPQAGKAHGPSLVGARVGLLMAPSAGWVASLLGVWLAGGVAVPLSPGLTEAQVRAVVQDSSLKAVVLDEERLDRCAWFEGIEGALRSRVSLHRDRRLVRVVPPGSRRRDGSTVTAYTPEDELYGGRREAPVENEAPAPGITPARPTPAPGITPAHPFAMMPRPSGDAGALLLPALDATGAPAGTLLTHDDLDALARRLGAAWEMREGDRVLLGLPADRVQDAVSAMLTALHAGSAIEILPRPGAREVWEALGRSTVWVGEPAMYQELFAAFDEASDDERARWEASARALRLATCGMAALPLVLSDRWRTLTGTIPLDTTWTPRHPVELHIRPRRAIQSSDELSPIEHRQMRAMFGGDDYLACIAEGIDDFPMDLEIADVVDARGEAVYRLYIWGSGVVYLLAPDALVCHAFASQHTCEVWEPAQRDLFWSMDRALRRGGHGFVQSMSFPWTEQARWDEAAGRPRGTAFSHRHILAQFPDPGAS